MPPPPEWVTLNSDGSVIPETGRAAAGGLFRDADGRCLAAFSMNLGICSITRAELRGAMTGLQIAWDRGFWRIIVQLDSCVAVQLLLGDGEDSHQHSSEIASSREMLDRDWMIKVEHIYREGNRVADYLAGIGHALPIGVHDVSSFDPCLSHHLLYDLLGISQTRFVMNER
ncbi:Putative ribonuclease H protein At1g65750 [Linum perenne]